MNRIYIYLFGLSIMLVSHFAAASLRDLPLMPWPQDIELKDGSFEINDTFIVEFNGPASPLLERARLRLVARLERQTGISIRVNTDEQTNNSGMIIDLSNVSLEGSKQSNSESYHLFVTDHSVVLRAESSLGVLHGIETLLQLVAQDSDNKWVIPAVNITDAPRFSWRGVMIDSSRHYLSVESIKRQIDGMAAAKFNVFHWHLTDDQGWRIESKLFPRLHQRGSDGLYYTQEEIMGVVSYAEDRGIRVVPEVGMPGHVSAIAAAYPELIASSGNKQNSYEIERQWGVHEPTLDPSNEKVYEFIDKIVGELAELFPGEYFHIGGDEVNPKLWDSSNAVQKFMAKHALADSDELQTYFNQRVERILSRHGKIMMGWDEILQPGLSKESVIQSWRGYDSLSNVARTGNKGVLSTGFYIDQPQPTAYHYRNDPNPKPRVLHDKIEKGEAWNTWEFSIPRRRGLPVNGRFTLIGEHTNEQRGYIDFDGRSRRNIDYIETRHGVTSFGLDTWMGSLQIEFNQRQLDVPAKATVANGPYSMLIEKVIEETPSAGLVLAPLSKAAEKRILGAEATLWSENVTSDVIDLRMWPRTFAIGERLWSAQFISDVESMYRRMKLVSDWAVLSIGLRHELQSKEGMLRLTGGHNIEPLQILAEAVEQAQYYHRHHAKSLAGNYHQDEPLNRFVDTLPVESYAVRRLNDLVKTWTLNQSDSHKLVQIRRILNRWKNNHQDVLSLIRSNSGLDNIEPIVQSVHDVADLGLSLLDLMMNKQKLKPKEVAKAKQTLSRAKQIQQEIVVSSAYAVEELLLAAY